MSVLKQILAVVAGLFVGVVVIVIIEGISSLMHPMPPGMDMTDPDQMAEFVAGLPVNAFLMVLLAWAVGIFLATYVARRLTPNRGIMPAVFVWAFFMAGVIMNTAMIPHPLWFWFAGIAVALFFGLLGIVMAAPSEYVVATTRNIKAPVDKVFRTLASIDEFKQAVPGIVNVEFLTDQHYGVGTRFRETRMMNGKEAATELEVTELVENERIRIVSDAGGSVWDTVFTVGESDNGTVMNMQMDARPHKFAAKIITPMIIGMVAKFVEQDMDSVKEFCETDTE